MRDARKLSRKEEAERRRRSINAPRSGNWVEAACVGTACATHVSCQEKEKHGKVDLTADAHVDVDGSEVDRGSRGKGKGKDKGKTRDKGMPEDAKAGEHSKDEDDVGKGGKHGKGKEGNDGDKSSKEDANGEAEVTDDGESAKSYTISGLPAEITDEDLFGYFSMWGAVFEVKPLGEGT